MASAIFIYFQLFYFLIRTIPAYYMQVFSWFIYLDIQFLH